MAPTSAVIRHSSPTDAHVEEMVEVLLDAFSEDTPYMLTMTGGKSELKKDLFRMLIRTAALEGELTVCQETMAPKRIVSLAISFGPDKMFLASQAQRELGLDEYLGRLPKEGKEWWDKYIAAVTNNSLPQKIWDSWYIVLMGTGSRQQGKGYGSAAMRNVLKMAENDKTVAMLTAVTEVNVAFYKSLGFQVVETSIVTGPFGTYTSYLMVWSTKQVSSQFQETPCH